MSFLRVIFAILFGIFLALEITQNIDKDEDNLLILCGSWAAAFIGGYVGPQHGCIKWPGWGGITGGMIGGVGSTLFYRVVVYFVIFFYENFVKANVLDP